MRPYSDHVSSLFAGLRLLQLLWCEVLFNTCADFHFFGVGSLIIMDCPLPLNAWILLATGTGSLKSPAPLAHGGHLSLQQFPPLL